MPYELIHLIGSPFRSRKSKYFTVFGRERTFDLLTSNRFYPTLLPVDGQLISLTVTTENLEGKFDYLQTFYNKIVTADLSPTSEKDNFVTHGRFSIYDTSESVYGIYLECLNFNLISVPPILIQKEIDGRKHNEIISMQRHFQWIDHSHYGKESIDATFNIIFVNFPRENIRYPEHTTINFKGQIIHAISIFGRVLVPGKSGAFSFPYVRLLFDSSLYSEISKNEILTCVLQVYTLYNIRDGNKEVPPINFVTAVVPFFGSFEELIPFFCNSFSDAGFLRKCIIDKKMLEKLRSQVLEGSPEYNKDIYSESRIHYLREHSDSYEFSISPTDSILKFIRGTISSDMGRSLLESALSSDNVKESLQQLITQLRVSSFIEGSLINPNLRRTILESFQGKNR